MSTPLLRGGGKSIEERRLHRKLLTAARKSPKTPRRKPRSKTRTCALWLDGEQLTPDPAYLNHLARTPKRKTQEPSRKTPKRVKVEGREPSRKTPKRVKVGEKEPSRKTPKRKTGKTPKQKTPKQKTPKQKTRKARKVRPSQEVGNKLIIYTQDFTPTGMYDALRDPNLVKFANKFAFVNGNFLPSRGEITFTGHAAIPSWNDVEWDDIKCQAEGVDIKVSPCDIGTSIKIFYRDAQSLGDYIDQLYTREISRSAHLRLFENIFHLFGTSDFVNHNMDVATLHFKKS